MAGRQAEINRKRELTIQADIKRLEIALVRRMQHQELLAAFLKTHSGPCILWTPSRGSEETAPLFAQRQQELDAYRVSHSRTWRLLRVQCRRAQRGPSHADPWKSQQMHQGQVREQRILLKPRMPEPCRRRKVREAQGYLPCQLIRTNICIFRSMLQTRPAASCSVACKLDF